jgi:hypothetical protein
MEIFLQMGLDGWNQIDPLREITFFKTAIRSPDEVLNPRVGSAAAPYVSTHEAMRAHHGSNQLENALIDRAA